MANALRMTRFDNGCLVEAYWNKPIVSGSPDEQKVFDFGVAGAVAAAKAYIQSIVLDTAPHNPPGTRYGVKLYRATNGVVIEDENGYTLFKLPGDAAALQAYFDALA